MIPDDNTLRRLHVDPLGIITKEEWKEEGQKDVHRGYNIFGTCRCLQAITPEVPGA